MNRRCFASVACLATALLVPTVSRAQNPPGGGFPPHRELVKAAYLGVGISEAGAALSKQLGLPEGVGLKVDYIDPEGAAAGLLEVHDVLHLLDDQILVNRQQLAVLVRLHAPGDVVNLKTIRGGKTVEIKATLLEKEVPPLQAWGAMGPAVDFGAPILRDFRLNLPEGFAPGAPGGQGPQPFGAVPQGMRTPEMQGPAGAAPAIRIQQLGQITDANAMGHAIAIGITDGKTTSTMAENGMRYSFTREGDKRHFKAEDQNGNVFFDGPVSTDEERELIPEPLRGKLETLEGGIGHTPVLRMTPMPLTPGQPATF